MNNYYIYSVLALGAMVMALFMALRTILHRQAVLAAPPVVEDVQMRLSVLPHDDSPRCFCGDAATEPMPYLKRGRNSFLRAYFAAPPLYKRVVDRSAPPTLCRVHAALADSQLDQFIYTDIRASLARTNAEIAARAASFERAALLTSLEASLSPEERKRVRIMQSNSGVQNGVSKNVPVLSTVVMGDERQLPS